MNLKKIIKKLGIKGMSIGWGLSGLAMLVMGYFGSNIGYSMGATFLMICAVAIILDIRDEKKKQQNNTTSL